MKSVDVSLLVILSSLAYSCAIDENGFEDPSILDIGSTTNENVRHRVPTTMTLGGPYVGVDEHVINCTMHGSWLKLRIERLETPRPLIPIRELDMVCEPIVMWANGMSIECDQHVTGGLVNWWDRFYVFLNGTEESGHRGSFHWAIDGDEHFWCVHKFKIIEVELEYTWR